MVEKKRLAELLDFENRKKVFEDVDSRFKFSVILMTGENAPQCETRCGFFLHDMEDLNDPERVFTLSPDDFKLFNPNTLTCPIFRRRRDAELTRKIYENVPILVRHRGDSPLASNSEGTKEINPWGIRFSTMFHMTNDTLLFHTAAELEEEGCYQDAADAGNVYTKGKVKYVPLYEGKMVQMYDHRAAGILVNPTNVHRPAQEAPTTLAQHTDPDYAPLSQFWVDKAQVLKCLPGQEVSWLLGYKDVTAPTNVRTMIPAAIPLSAVGNTFCLVKFAHGLPGQCLLANLSSFALDFAARQKVGGQHLNFFIVEQFPILPPKRYDEDWHGVKLSDFITARVLELCYTAHDLKGFAADLGYTGPPFAWDEERRLHLKCQLDALFFHLYGLTRAEAGEVLDTFPIVKRQDEARYGGRFRTRDLILAYANAYQAGNRDAWVKR